MVPVLSEEAAKAKARALRKGLAGYGLTIKHTQALELIARIEGATGWSALNARQSQQAPATSSPPAPAGVPSPGWVLVGQENLLPSHVQVDTVPVSMFGTERKAALYDALRVCGAPSQAWEPAVEQAQRLGALSAPPAEQRLPRPAGDERYEDDPAPCNVFGQTRAQVVRAALEEAAIDWMNVDEVFEEFRARSGLIRCYRGE